MKRGRILLLGGILLVVAGLVAWALSTRLEWSEREEWVGYSGEARVNPFLACQRLLERMGQRVSPIRGLPMGERLPDQNDVVLLPSRRVRMTEEQANALLAWVEEGGLLVAEGLTEEFRNSKETQDPLFRTVGARLVQHWDRSANPKPGFDPDTYSKANQDVRMELKDRSVRVRFGAWQELVDMDDRATRAVGNDSGYKLLQYDLGQGRLILCTNLACLANSHIAELDHADFISNLVLDWGPDNRVWIVIREETPSLVQWLGENAWRAMIALGILTTTWLWHSAARFGPPLPDPPEARRSLLEHLAACGRFQWRRKGGATLLKAARTATLTRLHRAHPGWGHLEPPEFRTRLSEFTGLGEDRIDRALHRESPTDPRIFMEAIQTLDLIRKKL